MGNRSEEYLRAIGVVDPWARDGLDQGVEALRHWIGADYALAYRPLRGAHSWELEFAALGGFRDISATRPVFEQSFRSTLDRRFGFYDPLHPEPGQRNRAVRFEDLGFAARDIAALPRPIEGLYRRVGLFGLSQLRMLLCEGPRLIAWIGGWREEPFSVVERDRLRRATRVLRQRMALETALKRAREVGPVLDTVMDALPGASLLLSAMGRVAHRNAAAAALMERDPGFVDRARAATPDSREFDRHVVHSAGWDRHVLAIRRTGPGDPETLRRAWSERFGLTPRQSEVLHCMLDGHSNRDIADRLGIAVGTAELHVSAVLSRAEQSSRARLLVAFREALAGSDHG